MTLQNYRFQRQGSYRYQIINKSIKQNIDKQGSTLNLQSKYRCSLINFFFWIKQNKIKLSAMHDPFQRQLHKPLEFRLLNFRNGIHQGEVISHPLKRQGFGITLDHNFLLALGNWNNNSLQGQSFIIFPDCTYFYGTITNNLPHQMCVYHSSMHLNIFSFINDKSQSTFIFDNLQNKTMRSMTVSQQMMQKLIKQIKVNENILVQEYNRNKDSNDIVLSGEEKYQNSVDKWQVLQKISKKSVPESARSYQQYVRTLASKPSKVGKSKLQIVQNKQCFQFGFNGSSIKCKINVTVPDTLQVKNIGFFDHSSQSFPINKVFKYTNRTIEQNIAGKSYVYVISPLIRPLQCINQLHLYYKKSLQYVNDYLKIDYLYRIKFIYTALQALFDSLSNKGSPRKLQTIHLSRSIYQNSMAKEKKIQNDLDKKEDLQEIKYKVYSMARKKLSNTNNSIIYRSPPRKNTLNSLNLSEFRSRSAEEANIRRIGMLTQKKIVKQPEPKIINRSYAYLNQDDKKLKAYSKVFDDKEKESTLQLSKKRQTLQLSRKRQSQCQLSKYAYLEEQTKQRQKKKIENIKTLTKYYQEIERQLKNESSTTNLKPKTKNKTKLKEPHDSSTIKTASQTKNEQSLMGPKKILKFGWQ